MVERVAEVFRLVLSHRIMIVVTMLKAVVITLTTLWTWATLTAVLTLATLTAFTALWTRTTLTTLWTRTALTLYISLGCRNSSRRLS